MGARQARFSAAHSGPDEEVSLMTKVRKAAKKGKKLNRKVLGSIKPLRAPTPASPGPVAIPYRMSADSGFGNYSHTCRDTNPEHLRGEIESAS
jgi:hypothetical protein